MAASALGTKDDPVSVSVPPVLAMEAPQLWERPVLSLFKHLGIEDSWKKARKVGDVKKTIDKRIGKRTFCIRGAISAANFIEIPNSLSKDPEDRAPIGATGQYIYVQYRSVPDMVVMFHIDLMTLDGQSMRLSCSSLYTTFKFVGQALRIPVRISPDGRWTVFAMDIPALLSTYATEPNRKAPEYKCLKGIKLCSNMIVRGVYTSHSIFSPKTLPADMVLPLAGNEPWHDTYEWVWCPQAPAEAISPDSVDLGFGASPPAGLDSPESLSSHNSVPEPASTQVRPERAPLHARTNRTFRLDRIIGNSSEESGSIAWGQNCASLVFTCERAVVCMEIDSSEDASTNTQQFIMGRHTANVNLVNVSNDKTLLVSSQAGREARVCLWDLPKQKWICDLHGHVSNVISSCFSADDLFLCTVGRDAQHRCQIIVWDVVALRSGRGVGMGPGTVATNLAIVARQISDFHLNRIKFNPADNTRLLSCGRENIRFWRVSRRHLPGCPAESSVNEYARGLEFHDLEFESSMKNASTSSTAVQVVFVASSAGTLLQVNYSNRQVLGLLRLHESAITCVVATEGYVVTGAMDGLLRLWPLDFSDYLMQAQHDSRVASVAVSNDDLKLAVSTGSGTLGILDVKSHAYSTCIRSHKTGVVATAEASHCDQFATAGKDGTIRVWEIQSGRQRYEFTASADPPSALAYHPCEQIIACGFASGSMRILSVAETSTMHEYQQHKEAVYQVLFASSGRLLYSSANDGSICVYDVASSYQPMRVVTADSLLGLKSALWLSVSPDGRFVVATSVDTACDGAVLDARTLKLVLRLDTSNDGTSRYPGLVKYSSVSATSEGVFLLTTNRGASYSLKAAVVEDSGMGLSSNVTPVPPATAVGRTIFRNKVLPIEAKSVIKATATHMGDVNDKEDNTERPAPFLLVSGRPTGESEACSDDVLYLQYLNHPLKVEMISGIPGDISSIFVSSSGKRIFAIDKSGYIFVWKWDEMAARSQAEETKPVASFDIEGEEAGFVCEEDASSPDDAHSQEVAEKTSIPDVNFPEVPDGRKAIKIFDRNAPGSRGMELTEGASLQRIVGYSGVARQNLLWNTAIGTLIYSVGCNLVVQDIRLVSQSFPGGHGSCISTLAQSSDGAIVVSGSGPVKGRSSDVNSALRVWTCSRQNELLASFSLHQHDDSGVQSICILVDNFFVSVSCYDEQLEGCMMILWDAAGRMHASIHVPDVVFEVCAMPPHRLRRPAATSGLRIVSCGVEGVFVWTIQERKFKSSRIDLTQAPSDACITSVMYMADIWGLGPSLLLGSMDGWLSFWSQSSKSIVGSWHVRDADQNQRDSIEIMNLYYSNSRVIVGAADGTVTVWELQKSRSVVPASQTLSISEAQITAMQWSEDGMTGLVGAADGVIHSVQLGEDVPAEDVLLCVAKSSTELPVALDFVLGARLFLSAGGDDGALRLIDSELNREIENIRVKGKSKCVAISCTNSFEDDSGDTRLWCAVAYSDGCVRIFDIFRVSMEAKIYPFENKEKAQTGKIAGISFMDRNHLLCCSADGCISVILISFDSDEADTMGDSSTCKVNISKESVQFCAGSMHSIRSIHSAPLNPKVAAITSVADGKGCVSIWYLQINDTAEEMCQVPISDEPIDACISPWDVNSVVCVSRLGSGQSKFECINLNTFDVTVSRTIDARVECIAAPCDTKCCKIALGLDNGSILILDESGAITSRCSGHSGPVAAVALSENRLVSSALLGETMVWDLNAN